MGPLVAPGRPVLRAGVTAAVLLAAQAGLQLAARHRERADAAARQKAREDAAARRKVVDLERLRLVIAWRDELGSRR